MKRFTLSHVGVVFATLALTSPLPAMAQSSPAPTQVAAHPRQPLSMAQVETHIKQLHDQLKITQAEQPQWDQYAQVMRDNAQQMGTAMQDRVANINDMNAVDDMQSYAQLAQVHASNMQKLSSAFKALYDSFPPQQKVIADGVFKARTQSRG